jgi:hypothetical protein
MPAHSTPAAQIVTPALHACRCVSVVKHELKLGALVAKYEKVKLQVEDLTDAWTSSLRRKTKVQRKTVVVRPKSAAERAQWGDEKTSVDKMEYKLWLLEDLQRQILEEQQQAKDMVSPRLALMVCDG